MNRPPVLLALTVLVVFSATFGLKVALRRDHGSAAVEAAGPVRQADSITRIVSLAPSITEMIYFLGLEEKLVGVTAYCKYPAAAQELEKVGGYATPDFEKIVMLKPDLIIMVKEHAKAGFEEKFTSLGFETLQADTSDITGIVNAMRAIAGRARRDRVTGQGPSILISVGRNMGSSGLRSVFAAGPDTYFTDLIEAVGGYNVCPESPNDYVDLAGEILLKLNPDIIIDIVPDLAAENVPEVVACWAALPGLQAVASGSVHVLRDEYVARPGVSFLKVVRDLGQAVKQWEHSTR